MIDSCWLGEIPRRVVADLDPLDLDRFFRDLPRLNQVGDEAALRDVLERAATGVDLAAISIWEALAAMRDLGMLVASLRRQAGPSLQLPAPVVKVLVDLGRVTGMPPRETVLHYCAWNPPGVRQRSFTGAPHERALISTTARCLDAFETAARLLLDLRHDDPAAPSYARTCHRAAAELAAAASAVQSRGSGLDPQRFVADLRAFFEPVTIDGRSYSGAAAAQAPMYLVDECVFGRSSGDPAIWALRDEVAESGLPRWRRAYQEAQQGPSVVETVAAVPDPEPRQVEAVRAIVAQLVAFRGRHRRLVATAYKHTPSEFRHGSAGADLQMIDGLLAATRQAQHDLSPAGGVRLRLSLAA